MLPGCRLGVGCGAHPPLSRSLNGKLRTNKSSEHIVLQLFDRVKTCVAHREKLGHNNTEHVKCNLIEV
jgi:hypothetical protein